MKDAGPLSTGLQFESTFRRGRS